VKDTGVPELQRRRHSLTVRSRKRAAHNFLNHLKTFATSVQNYVQGIGDVTEADREELRRKWESYATGAHDDQDASPFPAYLLVDDEDDDDDDDDEVSHIRDRVVTVDEHGELIGVMSRLAKVRTPY
jgi:hypothetical protein